MDIGVGDWVESLQSGRTFTKGSLYRVNDILHDAFMHCVVCGGNCGGLQFSNAANPRPRPGYVPAWAACCFRPIYRPKAELLRQVMTPTSTKYPADIIVEALARLGQPR